MPDTQPIQKMFARHGLRCTRQRVAIYEALYATRNHPTADELYRVVCDRMSGISLATVYNTLEAFCQAGLVQKLPGAGVNGSARFDANPDNHVHLCCHKSGTVADLPDDVGRRLLDRIPAEALQEFRELYGFQTHQIQIELSGEFADPEIARDMQNAATRRMAERVQGEGI
jgi:Fur family transcriptional regulator, peroxide stress response regulator